MVDSKNKISNESPETVALYYSYFQVPDPTALVKSQREFCEAHGITGRIRVAKEGINGTVAGTEESIEKYIKETESIPEVVAMRQEGSDRTIDWKLSLGRVGERVFPEGLLVKVAKEIVSLGGPGTRYSTSETGTHLDPKEFHNALEEAGPESVILDCRNTYEIAIGKFEGAIDPKLRSFHTFPEWLKKAQTDGVFNGKQKVFMYCTGGIRCEKATQLVKDTLPDVNDVFQLKGGIHRYLEQYGPNGKFQGLNFVFDGRIHQPFPQDVESGKKYKVVGKCSVCSIPYDKIVKTRRCHKCRMLVLVCDKCAVEKAPAEGEPPMVWCEEHQALSSQRPNKTKETVHHSSTESDPPMKRNKLNIDAVK